MNKGIVEIMLILGTKNEKILAKDNKPEILEIYPKNTTISYLNTLETMIFPEGYKIKEINETNIMMNLNVNYFTLCETYGKYKYITSLTFCEMIEENALNLEDSLDTMTFSVPTAICLISNEPIYEIQK